MLPKEAIKRYQDTVVKKLSDIADSNSVDDQRGGPKIGKLGLTDHQADWLFYQDCLTYNLGSFAKRWHYPAEVRSNRKFNLEEQDRFFIQSTLRLLVDADPSLIRLRFPIWQELVKMFDDQAKFDDPKFLELYQELSDQDKSLMKIALMMAHFLFFPENGHNIDLNYLNDFEQIHLIKILIKISRNVPKLHSFDLVVPQSKKPIGLLFNHLLTKIGINVNLYLEEKKIAGQQFTATEASNNSGKFVPSPVIETGFIKDVLGWKSPILPKVRFLESQQPASSSSAAEQPLPSELQKAIAEENENHLQSEKILEKITPDFDFYEGSLAAIQKGYPSSLDKYLAESLTKMSLNFFVKLCGDFLNLAQKIHGDQSVSLENLSYRFYQEMFKILSGFNKFRFNSARISELSPIEQEIIRLTELFLFNKLKLATVSNLDLDSEDDGFKSADTKNQPKETRTFKSIPRLLKIIRFKRKKTSNIHLRSNGDLTSTFHSELAEPKAENKLLLLTNLLKEKQYEQIIELFLESITAVNPELSSDLAKNWQLKNYLLYRAKFFTDQGQLPDFIFSITEKVIIDLFDLMLGLTTHRPPYTINARSVNEFTTAQLILEPFIKYWLPRSVYHFYPDWKPFRANLVSPRPEKYCPALGIRPLQFKSDQDLKAEKSPGFVLTNHPDQDLNNEEPPESILTNPNILIKSQFIALSGLGEVRYDKELSIAALIDRVKEDLARIKQSPIAKKDHLLTPLRAQSAADPDLDQDLNPQKWEDSDYLLIIYGLLAIAKKIGLEVEVQNRVRLASPGYDIPFRLFTATEFSGEFLTSLIDYILARDEPMIFKFLQPVSIGEFKLAVIAQLIKMSNGHDPVKLVFSTSDDYNATALVYQSIANQLGLSIQLKKADRIISHDREANIFWELPRIEDYKSFEGDNELIFYLGKIIQYLPIDEDLAYRTIAQDLLTPLGVFIPRFMILVQNFLSNIELQIEKKSPQEQATEKSSWSDQEKKLFSYWIQYNREFFGLIKNDRVLFLALIKFIWRKTQQSQISALTSLLPMINLKRISDLVRDR